MQQEVTGYQGDDEYIFVCYAHADSDIVLNEIAWLQDNRYNVWFDDAIAGGHEWTEEIAEAVADATHFLWFMSPNSVASKHCRNELHYAIECEKQVVMVHLEEVQLTRGLALSLGPTQAIMKYQLSAERYQGKLINALARNANVMSTSGLRNYRHRLPQPATTLIARDRELSELTDLMTNPETRMVTLLGPGGIGKTQLSTHLGKKIEGSFDDGAALILLDDVESADLVPSKILQSLGVPFSPHGDPCIQLCNYLQERSLLLILDNFERLVQASGVVSDILNQSAGSKVLVTSRERLNLQQEVVYNISSLDFPASTDDENFEEFGAVRLFNERARAADISFELQQNERGALVEILTLLNGMPLGIMLAAPWTALISCEEIASEINNSIDFLSSAGVDVPERHQSFRAVFEYSWRVLDANLKDVLSKLSVFKGAFDSKAAGAVAGASLPQLSELINKSLIYRQSRGWFAVHEILQNFCMEKLQEQPRNFETVQRTHAQFHADFVSAQGQNIRGENLVVALQELKPRFANIRAAWEWAIEQGDTGILDQTIQEIVIYFEIQDRQKDGLEFFTGFAKRISTMVPADVENENIRIRLHGYCLAAEAQFQLIDSKFDLCIDSANNALAILEPLDAQMEKAFCLFLLGQMSQVKGDFQDAIEKLRISVDQLSQIGDIYRKGHSLIVLAQVYAWRGELKDAQIHYQLAIDACEQARDHWGRSIAQMLLAETLLKDELGVARAEKLLSESLEYLWDIDGYRWIARCLRGNAHVKVVTGSHSDARKLLVEAITISVKLGDEFQVTCCKVELGEIDYHEQRYDIVEQIQLTRQIVTFSPAYPAIMRSLLIIVRALTQEGKLIPAAELLLAAEGMTNSSGYNEEIMVLRDSLTSLIGLSDYQDIEAGAQQRTLDQLLGLIVTDRLTQEQNT